MSASILLVYDEALSRQPSAIRELLALGLTLEPQWVELNG
jgi:hypothetical protein